MRYFDEIQKYSTNNRDPFYELAYRYYTPGMTVLDVGAGDGAFAEKLGDEHIYLIEGNLDAVKKLNEKYKNVYFLKIPQQFPFAPGFFNLIHCSHLVEHLQPQDLYFLIKEFDRCLSSKGILVISAPLLHEGFYDDLSHFKPYSPSVFMNYLGVDISSNRTRNIIANDYKTLKLQFRYKINQIPYFNVSWKRTLLKKLVFKLCDFLKKRNFGYYEKTGYTLILQKP